MLDLPVGHRGELGEHVAQVGVGIDAANIEGVPVQFLPAYNALVKEALSEAVETASDARSRPASGASRGDNVANGPRQGPTAILHLSC